MNDRAQLMQPHFQRLVQMQQNMQPIQAAQGSPAISTVGMGSPNFLLQQHHLQHQLQQIQLQSQQQIQLQQQLQKYSGLQASPMGLVNGGMVGAELSQNAMNIPHTPIPNNAISAVAETTNESHAANTAAANAASTSTNSNNAAPSASGIPAAMWLDRDNMLNMYIHDYMLKRGWKRSAEVFAEEVLQNTTDKSGDGEDSGRRNGAKRQQQALINSPYAFLFEWWGVFWDTFSAASQRGGSPEALAYIEVRDQSNNQE
jgi:hypothetical protein